MGRCWARGWGKHTFFVHEGPRRGTENTLTSFCPRRTRRGGEGRTSFCPRRGTEGRGELPFVHGGPRRKSLQGQSLVFPGGRGGTLFLVHEGARRQGQTHLNSDAEIAGGGRPQGAPLPIVFSRRYALRRAPIRGAPAGWMMWARTRGGGHPQGVPLRWDDVAAHTGGRAPTRGAPTVG